MLFIFGVFIPLFLTQRTFRTFFVHGNGSRVLLRQQGKMVFIGLYLSLLSLPGLLSLVTSPLEWALPAALTPKLALIVTWASVFFCYQKWKRLPDPVSYPFVVQMKRVFPETQLAKIREGMSERIDPQGELNFDEMLIFRSNRATPHEVLFLYCRHLIAQDHLVPPGIFVFESREVALVSFQTMQYDRVYGHRITYIPPEEVFMVDVREL